MTAALQKQFDPLLFAKEPTPLLPIEAVRGLTGLDEDGVLYLIEDGQLPFAFDLAMPDARRKELRVWRGAFASKNGGTSSASPTSRRGQGLAELVLPTPTIEEVIADVLGPSPLPTLNVRTLRHRWVCSSSHIHHLIEARCLAEAGGAERKRTNTRNVWRDSAAAFLRGRRSGSFATTTTEGLKA